MHTRSFFELTKNDASIAGGKGASLGEMTQAGIPVPPGFVVLAGAFEEFLMVTDLGVEIDSILHDVDVQKMHTVEHAAETIRKLILEAPMPEAIAEEIRQDFTRLGAPFVAVRSSATAEDSDSAAWAGQLDSFLNTTETTLLVNVQKCWASLFTPRAVFYRFEKGLHIQKISVAVVIQQMVESEISGIAFSVHPVTEDRNQLIIEAGYGLGEAIVSGQITPDSYVVEKEPRRILDKNIAEQERGIYRLESGGNEWRPIPPGKRDRQKLSDAQILELSELILRIENHYGFPCDIEWAYAAGPEPSEGKDGKFFIVQSRPITTLAEQPKETTTALIKIDKTISRDLSLTDIYAWHKGYTEGMKAWLGWSYSDSLFHVHDGFADIMRPPVEHLESFKNVVVGKMEGDEKWFSREYGTFLGKAEDIYAFYDSSETDLETCSREDLITSYLRYVQLITEIVGPFITMFWLPIWGESDQMLAKKYGKEIALGIDARKKSEQIFPRGDIFVRRLLGIANKEMRIATNLLEFVSHEELLAYLRDGKMPSIDTLKKRGKGFIYGREGIKFVGGKRDEIMQAFAELGYEYDVTDYSAEKEVKGNSAFGGKVKGRVRVVMRKDEIDKVVENEILVTSMTTPEFVPAMKKAAAFVTDEGGITCHAAIVARELKKPCIIGTKIATQVLHDGDLVEVDADAGVVRVLMAQGRNLPGESVDGGNVGYEKIYTRENSLMAFQVWEQHQTRTIADVLGWSDRPIIFDVHEGLASVYFHEHTFSNYDEKIAWKVSNDSQFIKKTMLWYGEILDYLEPIWGSMLPFEKKRDLLEFYDYAVKAWCGLDISYEAPRMDGLSDDDKRLAMNMRERAADFLEEIDHVFQRTLNAFYPELGDLVKYISIEEVRGETGFPTIEDLTERKRHFIYYDRKLYTDLNFDEFLKGERITIAEKGLGCIDTDTLRGQVAMEGKVQGRVRVLHRKADIPLMQSNEILVTAMTTPDYLPAMRMAAAFVTDEGGITCHAAIVARELKKPCIIGTKIATQVLKDGDLVEVDADNGVVRIISKNQ